MTASEGSTTPRSRRWNAPLAVIMRRNGSLFPAVVVLGFVSAVLEGLGIGILIPLLSVLLGQDLPAATPDAIRNIARFASQWDQASRATVLGSLILSIFLLKALIQAANLALQARLLEKLVHATRSAVGSKLLNVDYKFFVREDGARLLNVIYSDVWNLTNLINSMIILVSSAVAAMVIAGLLLLLDWRLTLIIAGCFLVGIFFFRHFRASLSDLSARAKAVSLALDANLQTIVYSQRTIRLFGQERREEDRFRQNSERYGAISERTSRYRSFAFPLIELAMVSLSLVVFFIGYRIGLSVAFMTAYLILLSRGQPYVKHLGDALLSAARYDASRREVDWLLTIPDAVCEPGSNHADFGQILKFDRVSYAYPNDGVALRDASFTLQPGKVTALIGPSGSGKSTVINLITRLVDPDRGEITLGELPIGRVAVEEWRKKVVVAGQDTDLIDGTIAENIAYGRPDATAEEIETVARLADAERFIAELPGGYAARVGRGGLRLSGGQRQRIGLARALLVRPELLILDEATNAVDGPSEEIILELLMSHARFRSVLIISHRPSTLARCEEGIVLDAGSVVAAGPIAQLDYHARQMGGS